MPTLLFILFIAAVALGLGSLGPVISGLLGVNF